MIVNILLILIYLESLKCSSETIPLKDIDFNKEAVRVLKYEPSPEDFYETFVRPSVPVLIKIRNPSWLSSLKKITHPNQINSHLQNVSGKAFKRPIWTEGRPTKVEQNFSSFLQNITTNKLYWDSMVPTNNSLLQHLPLPYCFQCEPFIDGYAYANLYVNHQKSTSVFHHDMSENLFYQISGTKTWFLTNHSNSDQAYADDRDARMQPGCSPINPEAVNLTKYPLAAEIQFFQVKLEPGDLLYVPWGWWHHVISEGVPNVAINIWFQIFKREIPEDHREISSFSEKFAELRKSSPDTILCSLQRVPFVSALDKKKNDFRRKVQKAYPIFFGCDDGSFNAISSNKGEYLWKYPIGSDAGSIPVLSKDEQLVYFAGENSIVYAIEVETGEVQWKYRLGGAVTAALRLSPDGLLLFVASHDQHVYAFNASHGKLFWSRGPLYDELWASPYVGSNYLIVCSMLRAGFTASEQFISSVFKINSHTGEIEWSYSTQSSVFASPTVDEEHGRVFVFSYDGFLHAIDVRSGEKLWKTQIGESGDSGLVYSSEDKSLFIVTLTGYVVCLDTNIISLPFRLVWIKNLTGDHEVMSSPLLVKNQKALYVAIGNSVYRMSSLTGEILWNFTSTSPFMSSPRLDKNGTLYIGGLSNDFFAINSTNGELKWSAATNGPVVGSAVFPEEFYDPSSSGALM